MGVGKAGGGRERQDMLGDEDPAKKGTFDMRPRRK